MLVCASLNHLCTLSQDEKEEGGGEGEEGLTFENVLVLLFAAVVGFSAIKFAFKSVVLLLSVIGTGLVSDAAVRPTGSVGSISSLYFVSS